MFRQIAAIACIGSLLVTSPRSTLAQPVISPTCLAGAKVTEKEAERLSDEARRSYEAGQIETAIKNWECALSIKEKLLGQGHLEVASTLNNLAIAYRARGDYSRSVALLEKALAIAEKVLGSEHPTVASLINNLAMNYYAMGSYAEAKEFALRALKIREKTLGPENQDIAFSLTNLAAMCSAVGDYEQAEALLTRALAILEKALGSENLLVASTLQNLAELSLAKADYARAEPLMLRALSIQEKARGPSHPDVAISLGSLAELYMAKGDYARAEPLMLRSLSIFTTTLGPAHPDEATALGRLAELYMAKGDYARAEPLLLRALGILVKTLGPDHPKAARTLNSLAEVYLAKGDFSRAEQLIQRALAIHEKTFGREHPDVARSLNSLAGLYVARGDYARAEPLVQRALSIREKSLGLAHPDVAKSLGSLAEVYLYKGDYARAEPLMLRALSIYESALGPDHPAVATSLSGLAKLHLAKGDYARAEPLMQRTLSILEKALGPDHPDVALALQNLAQLHWALDDTPLALVEMARATSIEDRNAARELAVGSDEQRRAYVEMLGGTIDRVISLHLLSAPRMKDAERLAFQTILRRKGLSLDAMSNSFANLRERLSPDGQIKFDNWRSLTAQYSALVQRGPGKEGRDAFRTVLQRLDDARQKVENDLSFMSKDLQAHLKLLTVEQVRAALPKDAALVELFRYRPFNPKAKGTESPWNPARFVAYVLHANGTIAFTDLGEAKSIADAAKAMRNDISRESVDPEPAAKRLHQLVMAPIQTLLGKTRQVYLSPDSTLNLVPFEALCDETGRYLVESLAITYIPSGRDLVRRGNSAPSRDAATVFAGPDYEAATEPETRPSRQFAPLLNTGAEAHSIATLSPGASTYEGAEATEAAVKALHAPKILHISTHGFFDENLPSLREPSRLPFDASHRPPVENALLRAGLAFAGANRGGVDQEDGILTALEASQLDLWGTKLVVLSASDTGVGHVENGDGVYGLRRAFAMAGAETIVMSLWQVEGRATTDLMKAYYQGLSTGGGRAEALRQAQLAMLADPNRSHPYYWASFIVSGNDSAMDGRPVEPTFGRVNPGARGCACEMGAYEDNDIGVWLGIVVAGIAVTLGRRRGAPVEKSGQADLIKRC